jgi:hypothetical protein
MVNFMRPVVSFLGNIKQIYMEHSLVATRSKCLVRGHLELLQLYDFVKDTQIISTLTGHKGDHVCQVPLSSFAAYSDGFLVSSAHFHLIEFPALRYPTFYGLYLSHFTPALQNYRSLGFMDYLLVVNARGIGLIFA